MAIAPIFQTPTDPEAVEEAETLTIMEIIAVVEPLMLIAEVIHVMYMVIILRTITIVLQDTISEEIIMVEILMLAEEASEMWEHAIHAVVEDISKEIVQTTEIMDTERTIHRSNSINNLSRTITQCQSCIALIRNESSKGRSKHFDVKLKALSAAYHEKFFDLQYLPTELMIADILTKPLSRNKFAVNRPKVVV